MDDEPGAGVSRGGTSLVIGLNEKSATPGNVAKAMLLATIFNLRMGSEGLDDQGFPRTQIVLSGGITKTPELAQLVADAFHVPVVVLAGAVEGTAWGAALMAKFRDEKLAGKGGEWQSFLAGHATDSARRFSPRSAAAATFDRMYARHKKLVALHGQLDAAVVAG
jgi:sugar (pentulose or hexulose) kinase